MPDAADTNRGDRPGLIRRVFGGLWSAVTWVRMALANLVFIAVLVVIVVALSHDGPPQVPERGALVLNPSGAIVEQLDMSDAARRCAGGDSPRHR